jgi:hypothetical protein
MYYTTNNVSNPTAHITKKKSRLKIYDGKDVYLNDKDNFEFEIHNPTQKSILCKIKLNGEYISNAGIVIKPGQRVFLERFLDTNNKFEFSTYEVKDTSANRTAIDLNGDVVVEFYNEQTYNQYPHLSGGNWGNGWTTINTGTITTGTPYYRNTTFTTSSSAPTMSYFSDTLSQSRSESLPRTRNLTRSLKSKKSIETGRVEKGEESKQNFTTVNKQFETYSFHQVRYKILPQSIKNKTTEDIKRYCDSCGNKVKSTHKFCSSCGHDLSSKKETIIKYTDDIRVLFNNKQYFMSTFNLTLPKLIELHEGKTIFLHKPSLGETYLRAVVI